jgi:DNA polymerase
MEEAIVTNIMAPRYGWPIPTYEQWACTAALAAAMALPRALDKAAKVMGISERKDSDGHDLMMRMARPRSKTKQMCTICHRLSCTVHHEMFRTTLTWWNDEDRKRRLGAYCMQDVRTERGLCDVLRMLPGEGSALASDMWRQAA